MPQKQPERSLVELCALFGVSRQAYYLAQKTAHKTDISHMVVLVGISAKVYACFAFMLTPFFAPK